MEKDHIVICSFITQAFKALW